MNFNLDEKRIDTIMKELMPYLHGVGEGLLSIALPINGSCVTSINFPKLPEDASISVKQAISKVIDSIDEMVHPIPEWITITLVLHVADDNTVVMDIAAIANTSNIQYTNQSITKSWCFTKQEYNYCLVKDGTVYSVLIPGFFRVCTFGNTVEEAMEMARDGLQSHVLWMQADGDVIPEYIDKETSKTMVVDYLKSLDIEISEEDISTHSVTIDLYAPREF